MYMYDWPNIDSEDDCHTGCQKISCDQQHSFSGLHQPGQSINQPQTLASVWCYITIVFNFTQPLGVFHQEEIVFRLPSIIPYMVRRQNVSCRSCKLAKSKISVIVHWQQILRKMFSLLHSWLYWYLPEKSCHLFADSSINNLADHDRTGWS